MSQKKAAPPAATAPTAAPPLSLVPPRRWMPPGTLPYTSLSSSSLQHSNSVNNDNKEDGPLGEPRDHDVVCGRGGFANNHPGNLWYRKIINCNRAVYRTSKKTEKLMLSKAVVAVVQNRNPGGRFVERNSDGEWFPVDDQRAIAKTSQALRETNNSAHDDTEANADQIRRLVSQQLARMQSEAVMMAMNKKAQVEQPPERPPLKRRRTNASTGDDQPPKKKRESRKSGTLARLLNETKSFLTNPSRIRKNPPPPPPPTVQQHPLIQQQQFRRHMFQQQYMNPHPGAPAMSPHPGAPAMSSGPPMPAIIHPMMVPPLMQPVRYSSSLLPGVAVAPPLQRAGPPAMHSAGPPTATGQERRTSGVAAARSPSPGSMLPFQPPVVVPSSREAESALSLLSRLSPPMRRNSNVQEVLPVAKLPPVDDKTFDSALAMLSRRLPSPSSEPNQEEPFPVQLHPAEAARMPPEEQGDGEEEDSKPAAIDATETTETSTLGEDDNVPPPPLSRLTSQVSDWLQCFFPVNGENPSPDNNKNGSEENAEDDGIPPPPDALARSVSSALLALAATPANFLSNLSNFWDRSFSSEEQDEDLPLPQLPPPPPGGPVPPPEAFAALPKSVNAGRPGMGPNLSAEQAYWGKPMKKEKRPSLLDDDDD